MSNLSIGQKKSTCAENHKSLNKQENLDIQSGCISSDPIDSLRHQCNVEIHNVFFNKKQNQINLDEYLENFPGLPVSSEIAARWMRDICSAILFLHKNMLFLGKLTLKDILIDDRGHAGILLSTSLNFSRKRTVLSDYSSDLKYLGAILFRLVTGQQSTMQSSVTANLGTISISKEGYKLALLLLSKYKQIRPDVGFVLYHPWIEEECAKPWNSVYFFKKGNK